MGGGSHERHMRVTWGEGHIETHEGHMGGGSHERHMRVTWGEGHMGVTCNHICSVH